MRIDFHFTPGQVDELALRDKTVVVIDVLRSSTTIAVALANGAREIIPVASLERAVNVSVSQGDAMLRGGERNGKMIEGFALGNSPREYTEEKVRGKGILFTTSNGTTAIEKARFAKGLVVCGFVNMSRVVKFISDLEGDVVVVCSGRNGMFSLEDTVCAGMLLRNVVDKGVHAELSDGAHAAVSLFKSFGKNLLKMLKGSEHGRYLISIGFENDLPVCAGVDTIPVLPQLVGNVIRIDPAQGVAQQARTAANNH
jgi:2-phosphosulfolactate phosphatase